jgi:hypothetical protein
MSALANLDVAILQLNEPAILNQFVDLIKLPIENYDFIESTSEIKIKALGFGLDETGNLPDRLKFTRMQILDQKKCREIYPNIDSEILCAIGFYNSSSNSCLGDSGE